MIVDESFWFSLVIRFENGDRIAVSYRCDSVQDAIDLLGSIVGLFPDAEHLDLDATRTYWLGPGDFRERLRVLIDRSAFHGQDSYARLVKSDWYGKHVYEHERFDHADLAKIFVEGIMKGAERHEPEA